MNSTFSKVLPTPVKTKHVGVYYKEVEQTTIDDKGRTRTKVTDKVYLIRYRDNGKAMFVTLGKYSEGIREAYCKTKRDEYMVLAKNGELPPQLEQRLKKKSVTLDNVAEDHYTHKALHNRNNAHAKQRYTLHIKPTLGDKSIAEITVADIEKLQQQKAKKYTPKTTNNILSELSTIFSYAIKHGIVTSSPTTQLSKLKVDNKRERYLNKDEVSELLDAVHDNALLYTFILLALHTGARVGAICKLTAKDINFERGHISMLDEKNAEKYTCYLQDQKLIEMLHKRIEAVGNRKPILDDGLSESGLTDRTKRKAAKVLNKLFNDDKTTIKDRVVVHTLRHSFASNLAINGVPILTIKKLMNHRDINQTLRYAKLAPDSGENAIKELYK